MDFQKIFLCLYLFLSKKLSYEIVQVFIILIYYVIFEFLFYNVVTKSVNECLHD